MKKQADSERGYSKKELIQIVQKIDRDNHQRKIKNGMLKPNSKISGRSHDFSIDSCHHTISTSLRDLKDKYQDLYPEK